MAKKTLSKRDNAVRIVNRMLSRKTPASRAQILAELQEKADLSAAGAATYFQNVKLGRWV